MVGSRSAIGDTVNLASHLEGAAKGELDLLRVKGRQLPVRVHELVGLAGTVPPAHLARFAEGLTLYRARRFAEAREAFLASPEDPPSRVFAARCETWMNQPPPEDWDGVFSLETK